MILKQSSAQIDSNGLSLISKIYLGCLVVAYTFGSIAFQGQFLGVNLKWASIILLIFSLSFFREKKSLFILNQPSTILFITFAGIEATNIITNVSSHPGGFVTLLFMALMSFTFYNLSLPVLQLILSYTYYNIASLIILSAFQGLSGVTILQLAPEVTDYIENNNLQEQIIRFRGVFENPNSLAIYSLVAICWVFGSIISPKFKSSYRLTNSINLLFLVVAGLASLYCGTATYSLQYPAGILLVIIGLRLNTKFDKLSFKRLIFEIVIAIFVYFAGVYLFNLYLITPQERSGARWEFFKEAFSQTDRWYLTGYGYGQNRVDNITIDIGIAKWLLELGFFSLSMLIFYIIYIFQIFYKLRRSNTDFNISKLYIGYVNILASWLFENVIYSPLYVTTTIWIIVSIIIHKIEIKHKISH